MNQRPPFFSYRTERGRNVFNGLLAVLGATLFVIWTTKWLRGDQDRYPNQIIGGLTLTAVLTLLPISHFVRNEKLRWIIFGIAAILLVFCFSLIFHGGSGGSNQP
jgi:hypothetical protein